ncbi:bifunctional tRNA (5-methylaminomethyl-2-thiouridine)(34)-methyltransferase MnmD/FAD-dependent 5-carboxymethylaminomethyl-2-thiouridine(34) oxidoreductase MnmC [Pseudoalteromonas sp. C2R02]|uniref:bifunctional tRNA (5-methylaminomethyl-2-thiouridine)(34)-methyltransferase MnmD/FAD-dependent 5-carboxymethylaminomethyl-2-thiouridine(34) oxidoreductase MnmC n=1 Tax=Pseudoalteromonas sp. C2R02 TaxID=2841565 RepID=UPI001C086933|nr:bifunctional tRNA (5-methylaminomethyl-2-thiouridine)(34)-methyltransferase MnmD/FAD-dependent 5-carboxymethylaminomethyl-2-thiouridine(34) oxidoreductase MnmC [Pseudoalteromonas sp. C2R02]MBU2971331.1 bifunctional tRNA (5-methylaminomethyl-2-thiouridine)(34)-methyltransferase MnmD/FAD-dependent 5-carboxymethylaminomethyl-2-thiouridine(34) oxidoreductase MnmC [Pseudoalteromonas sp. C2R02]
MIENAHIYFNQSGTPVADKFDDIYFSTDDGLAESSFVFVEKNRIIERFCNHDQNHFAIAETGFGTGLNFLNTWQQFENSENKTVKKLHFISFEKYPIKKSDLAQSLAAWPSLKPYAEQLVDLYPVAMQGCHRLEFSNGSIVLDLWFGDIQDTLPQICFQEKGIIDAWYLDGFAPSKNPDMWQQSLFNGMANLGRHNCTFATFTASGFVRRGLIEAGFEVKKHKGFGRKREMISGQLNNANDKFSEPKYYPRDNVDINKIAIIGGGIATSSLALSLSKRNTEFEVFCKDEKVAMGASHNHQGALYPHLQANFSRESQFYAHSFFYARRCFDEVLAKGYEFPYQWCGVLLHGINAEKQKRQKSLIDQNNWPSELINFVSPEQASAIANVDTPYSGLFIKHGGWINPPKLVEAMLAYSQSNKAFKLHTNTKIEKYYQKDNAWYLFDGKNEYGPYSQVIIAAGEHSDTFEQTKSLDLHPVRGQVSHVKATAKSAKLATVLCHKGYLTPQYLDHHCIGATFTKNSKETHISDDDNNINLKQVTDFYGDCEFSSGLNNITSAKAAIRCTSFDHMPLVGQVTDIDNYQTSFATLRHGSKYGYLPYQTSTPGLYIFTGLGARGLCSAPLSAELLCSELFNEPLPIDLAMNQALHPARFIVRDLKRNKV